MIAVRLENAIRDAKTMDPHRLSDDFDKSVNVVKYIMMSQTFTLHLI